ncbi:MAG: hypothetical protein ACLTYD_05345 [Oscillospiraceae bacterium]
MKKKPAGGIKKKTLMGTVSPSEIKTKTTRRRQKAHKKTGG